MKFSRILLPAAFSAVYGQQFFDRRADSKCSPGNNCQRGVGGTNGVKPPLSSRLADCASLNVVTVIPGTVSDITTSTTYVTQFPTQITARAFPPSQPRAAAVGDDGYTTVTPTAVPTYATYCSSASAYYSACSCAGVTRVTTTVPTPTTYTSTTTTTVCIFKNSVKRAAAALGYEMGEHFDAVYWDGIRF